MRGLLWLPFHWRGRGVPTRKQGEGLDCGRGRGHPFRGLLHTGDCEVCEARCEGSQLLCQRRCREQLRMRHDVVAQHRLHIGYEDVGGPNGLAPGGQECQNMVQELLKKTQHTIRIVDGRQEVSTAQNCCC